jgi:glyoxylase-like metal-dependent hydrolase (beta-lactamase superfamily II)
MQIHIIDLNFQGIHDAIAAFVVESGPNKILIETGPASTLPYLEAAVKLNGWQLSDFQHVLLSHIHFDHAGAAWYLARQSATIYVHPRGLAHLANPEKLYLSAQQIYGDKMDILWGKMEQIPENQLIAPTHGEQYQWGNIKATAWHTPGHAIHHIAWRIQDISTGESVLFTGDAAGVKIGDGPVMPPCPPPDIQIEQWLESINLMKDLDVKCLFLTHYGMVSNIPQHFRQLEERLKAWKAWMLPYFRQGKPIAEIVPDFQAFVREDLLQNGVAEADLEIYEAANPAFMSVTGLMRYWSKTGVPD